MPCVTLTLYSGGVGSARDSYLLLNIRILAYRERRVKTCARSSI